MEPESNKISTFTYKCIGSAKYKTVNILENTSRNRIKTIQTVIGLLGNFGEKQLRLLENFRENSLVSSTKNPKKNVGVEGGPSRFKETLATHKQSQGMNLVWI